jgi:hypothetical protein
MYWEFGLVTFEYFLVVITQKYNLTACNFCPLGVPNGIGRQMISDYEFLLGFVSFPDIRRVYL